MPESALDLHDPDQCNGLQVVNALITEYDADGDGQLSFDEFKTMLSACSGAKADEGPVQL